MKYINTYILEKLNLGKDTNINQYYSNQTLKNFKSFYNSIDEADANYIVDKYVEHWPMDDEAKEVAGGVTAFELLFYLAACLIEDNNPIDKLSRLGYKNYPGKNNPYDTGFGYECDNGNGVELIDFCRDWCNKNYQEWEKIFDLCKKYNKDLNTIKIEQFFSKVLDV